MRRRLRGARSSVARAVAVLGLACAFAGLRVAQAQAPHIVGTWKLNVAASRLPGPPPQVHVGRYSLASDGTLIGKARYAETTVDSHTFLFVFDRQDADPGR